MKGLLLVNVGTPDDPSVPAVRRFLREFLWDPYVLDMNPVSRFMLLYGLILPFRPKKSAAAYRQIWTEEGSPLLVHGEALRQGVAEALGSDWVVVFGMRYQKPPLAKALQRLFEADLDEIVVLPLYPQYALSSTETTVKAIERLATSQTDAPPIRFVPPFFADQGYIQAAAQLCQTVQTGFAPDHVLFSFHGLPERQIRATSPNAERCRFDETCCDSVDAENAQCYRAQSYHTARAIAEHMGLERTQWSVGFQSRLGNTPWIRPYTDHLITELAERGVKRLLVSCPSFVADCLETLEEIGIRARADFIEAGGHELGLVPCVNSEPAWVEAVTRLAKVPAAAQDT